MGERVSCNENKAQTSVFLMYDFYKIFVIQIHTSMNQAK